MDDSNVDSQTGHKKGKLRRRSSETNLAADFLTIPPDKEKSASKFSLIDKFADASKAISDKQKTKLPFSLFKKAKSREPSPAPERRKKLKAVEAFAARSKTIPAKIQVSSSEYSEESETESLGIGLDINVEQVRKQHALKKTMSDASYGSEAVESESDMHELEAAMDYIDEYYYGVRIFPGQDPTHVYVGWVTSGFHMYGSTFDMKKIRNVVVCSLDYEYKLTSR